MRSVSIRTLQRGRSFEQHLTHIDTSGLLGATQVRTRLRGIKVRIRG